MKMKKILATILSVAVLLSVGCFAVSAEENAAVSVSAGYDALMAQFEKGKGPETNGYSLDYRYYSPEKENDDTKYPLVIWLHGMGEGASEGKQIEKNDVAYWSSAEFQSRFSGAEGAYILVPRSLEEKSIFWDDTMILPLRATIDAFIAENSENIDLSRIYIGGFSMGGKMTLKMAIAYPEMFAAIFPICPAWNSSEELVEYIADIPVWLTSGKGDFIVNYNSSVVPTWNKIVTASNNPELCRFSTLSTVRYADGSIAISAHYAWFAVSHDMFSDKNGDYPDMTTVNGLGEKVVLTYPDGMISWLSQFTSDFDGTPATDTGNIDIENGSSGFFSLETLEYFLAPLIDFFKKVIDILKQIF